MTTKIEGHEVTEIDYGRIVLCDYPNRRFTARIIGLSEFSCTGDDQHVMLLRVTDSKPIMLPASKLRWVDV